jgi:predicted type IV restriction endonuclease
VRPEFSTQSGKPDYALLGPEGRPTAFVGVKALGKPEDLTQYISYCVSGGWATS